MSTSESKITLTKEGLDYQKKMTNPFFFWSAMMVKLPSVAFWKLKIKTLSPEKCEISMPFSWRTQNPFQSIYFAALAGAGELSTGALCQMALAGRGKFSMLVVDFKAEFHKKANTQTTFICADGNALFTLIEGMQPNDTAQLQMVSTGRNTAGEVVAKFYITWSIKRKS